MLVPSSPYVYDERSFSDLFDMYIDKIHDYIYAQTHSHYIAEEVAQELLIILWKKRADLHKVQNIDHYIFRIARNLSLRLLKKAATDNIIATEFYRRSAGRGSQGSTVTDEVNLKAVQSAIDKAIVRLPPQPRKVYLLSRRHQLKFGEIAVQMGISPNTVKNHLNKALRDIKEYLALQGYQLVTTALLIRVCLTL